MSLIAFPRQHGAWTVLISCFIIGSGAGRGFGLESILFLVSVVAVFLGRAGLSYYLCLSPGVKEKKDLLLWIVLYSGIFLAAGAFLVLGYNLWLLGLFGIAGLALAAFSLFLEKAQKDATLSGQMINVLGLSLVSPAGEYCSSGSYSSNTAGVWLVCFPFFLGGVLYVRSLVRKRLNTSGQFMERLKAGLPSLVFHLSALLALAVLGKFRVVPLAAPLVLAPAFLRALWPIIRRRTSPLPVKLIGRWELVHTLIFLIITILIFRLDAGGGQV